MWGQDAAKVPVTWIVAVPQGRVTSPCGRHVVEVARGAVLIDGQRIRSTDGDVFVIAPPTWRRNGSALAWIEPQPRRGAPGRRPRSDAFVQ
jgi:hypothetical protein